LNYGGGKRGILGGGVAVLISEASSVMLRCGWNEAACRLGKLTFLLW